MFIIGIDLGNEYSQVCYYNVAKSEPESVSFQSPAADLRVPTVVLREYNNTNGWMAGEVAVSCSRLGEGVLFDKLLDAAAAGQKVTKEGYRSVLQGFLWCTLLFCFNQRKKALAGMKNRTGYVLP